MTKKAATETKADKSKADAHAHASRQAVNPSRNQEEIAKGEHIEQNKPTISEAMGHSGPNATLDDIGKGSVTELAPAVRSVESDGQPDRVVQQGDEVMVHGRAIIDGQTSMHGKVIKVNEDGSIAVRVLRATGDTFDVPGKVSNRNPGDGSFYWTWPAEETLEQDRKRA